MCARILLLRDAAKALVRWWSGTAGASCGAVGVSLGPEQQRANVIAVVDAHNSDGPGRGPDRRIRQVPCITSWHGVWRWSGAIWERQKNESRAVLRNTILETAVVNAAPCTARARSLVDAWGPGRLAGDSVQRRGATW